MAKGGMHGKGGACVAGGVYGGRVCMVAGIRSRRDGHCSGRYGSYWNAFLLFSCAQTLFIKSAKV